jgi:hypothetical protein
MTISSSVFDNNSPIPLKYGRKFDDVNPPLDFSGIPQGAAELALVVDDPDAPSGTFTHWVVYNIPADTSQIAEGEVPAGAMQGKTDYGQAGYGGPMPPSGTHRYFFKLFALGSKLNLQAKATSQELASAMDGHVLAKAELVGTYSADNG